MAQLPVIYADVCCLNRPLDDLQQSRIRLEAEAMISLLQKCRQEKWVLLNSDAIKFEISRNPDPFKKEQLESILSVATCVIPSSEAIELRASALMELGFKFYDALHLAFAEAGEADAFLTTDDRLLRKAQQYRDLITVTVENPVIWLMVTLQEDGNEVS
ncbi:MAG: PIN domain-containing protein [Cyanobacteriota bacterium]|nr:PIN domain-containing protein [Cyanobacteriota bacterium]